MCLASARSALECGDEATAFIGREAPCGEARYRCLVRLPWLDTRAPRQAKAAASRPHSKAPRSLQSRGVLLAGRHQELAMPDHSLTVVVLIATRMAAARDSEIYHDHPAPDTPG
jgi:hypothetical protein